MWRRLAIGACLVAIYTIIYYYMHFYVTPETRFLLMVQDLRCGILSERDISVIFPEADYSRETFSLEEGTEVWVIFHEKPNKDLRARIIGEGMNSKEVMDFAQWDSHGLIVSFDESGKVTGYRWERGLKRGVLAAHRRGPRLSDSE